MADNLLYSEPGSGSSIATDDVGGVHYQRVKLSFGADGSAADVQTTAPLPVVPGLTADIAGASSHFDSDGDNTAQAIKVSSGRLVGLIVGNLNSTTCWVQLFDAATGSVTVGTTTPLLSIPIPPGDGVNIYGQIQSDFAFPVEFATAITYACTTTATGSGDPATGLTVNALFK